MERPDHSRVALVLIALLAALLVPAGATASTPRAAADFTPMKLGDRGWDVRVLQSRLHQLDLHSEVITGLFDRPTRQGVRTFESRRAGWRVDGVVDERTWKAIVRRTEKPSREALHNVYQPGPALLSRGDQGRGVREVQARLKQLGRYTGTVTGRYRRTTVVGVRAFQDAQRIPETGEVDRRTLDRLRSRTRPPTRAELFNIVPAGPRLDARCLTGRAMCVDKTSRSLRWVVDGVVHKTMDVRFGSAELPTREGAFMVFRKSRDHVSSLYNTPMPFAMFFSGGQAVHYSPDFAATGYNGASHGCVNVRDRAGIEWLFDRVRLGDKVIVHRS